MSKRCFWACAAFDSLKESIKQMVEDYEERFTNDVWEGTDKNLWPLEDLLSRRSIHYKTEMTTVRERIEKFLCLLKDLSHSVDLRQKEIVDQEARRSAMVADAAANASTIAIQQGHNIRLLTTVSIFFLPLTYVTSIFGMTNMPTEQSYWMFGVVTTAVCVPFFVLVAYLNNKIGPAFWRRQAERTAQSFKGLVVWLEQVRGYLHERLRRLGAKTGRQDASVLQDRSGIA